MAQEIDWQATAAMTQGIGSVVAILVAIALSWWQQHEGRRLQQRQLERARYERVSGVGGLLEALYVELYDAKNAAGSGGWSEFITSTFDRHRLQRALDGLNHTPLHELGNWRIITACLRAREAGIRAAAMLEQLQEDNQKHPVSLSDTDYGELYQLFECVNDAMAPVVRALAYDYYEVGPLSEWKEHLDFPTALIPKHKRPRPISAVNRRLRFEAVRAGIRKSQTLGEWLWAIWNWRDPRRRRASEAGA